MDEEQEQQVNMGLLIYGTRASKDKSGAYLFLPDDQAKVPSGAWEGSLMRLCRE